MDRNLLFSAQNIVWFFLHLAKELNARADAKHKELFTILVQLTNSTKELNTYDEIYDCLDVEVKLKDICERLE